MNKLVFIVFVLFSLSDKVYGQKASLTGKVTDLLGENRKFVVYAERGDKAGVKYYWLTDSLGNFHMDTVEFGIYTFSVSYSLRDEYKFFKIKVDSVSENLNLVVPVCEILNTSGICPSCLKQDSVFKLCPDIINDVWFIDKRTEKQYISKIKKQGYETGFDDCVVWVEEMEDKIDDSCFHWFCIRDKLIF